MNNDDSNKKVVQLEFDNTNFERNTKKSMSTLNKLDKKLRFEGASKELTAVTAKFSALQVAAITSIARITTRIIDMGQALVKSLSIDNVMVGWNKYEQKTVSLATLMAQSIKIAGKEISDVTEKLEVVNDLLDELNWFSDETSYSFTDMVDNIGKFTAAGQDLDSSVKAMMGIANWAALSGQNAATASRAMYQLAQAMGKGKIQLIDYKSIQNANMDTQEFRKTVLDTAVSLGQLTKSGEKYITKTGKAFDIGQFAEKLNEGWFTSEVLTKSLSKYSAAVEKIYEISSETGLTASEVIEKYSDELDEFGVKAFRAAQEARTFSDALNSVKDAVSSKWLNTAEKIFGNYKEAAKLWTDLANELYDVFAESGNFRNEYLDIWNKLEGRADLFAHDPNNPDKQGAFWNLYDAVVAVRNLVSEAWNDIFPKSQFRGASSSVKEIGNGLKQFTERLRKATAQIKAAASQLETLKNVLRTIFTLFRLGLLTIKSIWYAVEPVFEWLGKIINTASKRINSLASSTGILDRIANFVVIAATKVHDALEELFYFLNPKTSGNIAIVGFGKVSDFLINAFKKIKKYATEAAGAISNFFGSITGQSGKSSGNLLGNKRRRNNYLAIASYDGGELGSLVEAIKKLSFFDKIKDSVSKFADTMRTFVAWFVERVNTSNNLIFVAIRAIRDLYGTLTKFADYMIRLVLTNINDVVQSIAEVIKAASEAIIVLIKDALNILSTLIRLLTSFVNMFSNVVVALMKVFGKIFDRVADRIEAIADRIDIDRILDTFSNLFKSVGNLFIDGILPLASAAIDAVTNGLKKLTQNIKNNQSAISDATKTTLKWIAIIGGALGIIIAGIIAVKSTIESINVLVRPISYAIGDLTDSIYAVANAKLMSAVAALISSIGKVLMQLAMSVLIIASIPQDGFIRATIALGVMTALIGGIVIAIVALTKVTDSAGSVTTEFTKTLDKGFIKGLKGSIKGALDLRKLLGQYATLTSVAMLISSFGYALKSIATSFLIFDMVGVKGLVTGFATLALVIGSVVGFMFLIKKIKLTEKDTKSLYNVGAILSRMSLLLFTISLSVSLLAGLDYGKMWSAVGAVITIMAALAALMFALTGIQKLLQSKTIKGAESLHKPDFNTSPLWAAMASLVVIVGAVVALAILDQNKVWNAVRVMLTIIGAIIVLVGAISAIQRFLLTDKNFKAIGGASTAQKAITSIIGGVVVMALSVALLAQIDTDKLWNSFGVIGALAGIMIGMALLLGIFTKTKLIDEKTMLAVGVIALCMSMLVSLALVAAVLAQFDTGKMWEAVKVIAALSGVVVGVVVVAALLGTLSLAFPPIIAGMYLFLGAVLMFSASMLMLAASMELFVKLAPYAQDAADAFGTFLSAILDVIITLGPKIAETFLSVALNTLEKIKEYAPKIVTVLIEIMVNVCISFLSGYAKALAALEPVFIKFLKTMLAMAIKTVVDFLDHIPTTIVKGFMVIANKLVSTILRCLALPLKSNIFTKWAGDLLDKAADALDGQVSNLANEIEDIASGNELAQAVANARDVMSSNGESIGGSFGGGLLSSIKSAIGSASSIDEESLTITPVLDLSNVRSGYRTIGNMMSNLDSSTSIGLAGNISRSMSKQTSPENQNTYNNTTNNNESVYNTFNITSSDPKAVADEIDRRLNKISMRRKAANG